MISNEKLINYKVVALIKIYNFGLVQFSIQGCLKILVF
jgi:sulfatase maturation enzyme AslB (radical SAM superfamily)